MFNSPFLPNRHLIAAGPRAWAFARSGLMAYFARQADSRIIFIRNAVNKSANNAVVKLETLNLLSARSLATIGNLALRELVVSSSDEQHRHLTSLFYDEWSSSLAMTRDGATSRRMTWHAPSHIMQEIRRLSGLYQQREPGPIRTNASDGSQHGEFFMRNTLEVMGFVAAGATVSADESIIAAHRETTRDWLRSLNIDPASLDGRESSRQRERDELPIEVYQRTLPTEQMQRGQVITPQTLIDLLAQQQGALAKKIETELGGSQSMPSWWTERWLTLDVTSAETQATRLSFVYNDILTTAINDRSSHVKWLVIDDPALLKGPSLHHLESIVRQGRAYGIGLVLMAEDRSHLPRLLLDHIALTVSDYSESESDDNKNANRDGICFQSSFINDGLSVRVPEAMTSALDQFHGSQLIENGYYQELPQVQMLQDIKG